ncbi:chemotaxis protein CheA [Halanaerobiaceae bacterium Z-7014]|uniref:Chemotaxis protein CheA n=1 Tax=Halonatronomonas betaini TaxID=2778430 RepID=A0A931AXM2_9FIRM|nr:chemotaxis protein CheA [Halonatronomonas betaini]MBF8436688.1 chemotaxis protein CheA [Halonatronomonas betaini]
MDEQYLQMFFDESDEYIQVLNENILALEQDPDDKDVINSIFRAAHSLKGMAATMGFDRLTSLTHKLENALDKIRNDELKLDTEMIDSLFAGLDLITSIVNDIKDSGEELTEVQDYVDELNEMIASHSGEVAVDSVISNTDNADVSVANDVVLDLSNDEKEEILDNKGETDYIYGVLVELEEDSMLKSVRAYMVLKTAAEVGYIVKSSPTRDEIENEDDDNIGREIKFVLISHLAAEELENELFDIIDVQDVKIDNVELDFSEVKKNKAEKSSSSKKSKSSSNKTNVEVSPTVRVDISKLDTLMNMVGELLINKTRLEGLKLEHDTYNDIIGQLDRVTMELHHVVMQIRMVPIGGIFNRFPRMIRDLSKELDKEVDLIIEGAETELDRSIIDELADPLVHLLRNAVDHGIEQKDVRKEKDKPVEGKILLKAYQKGSEILIEVEDDGKGLDGDKLAEKAIEKGITTREDVENMDEREKLHFIFAPGFSTTEEVSDVSGRGVGMDVVKSVVESLDGQIMIESEKDIGTRFTISLPLTLAITQALMVKIDDEIFAIPLNAISETLTITPDRLKQVRGQDVIVLRDKTIPIKEAARQLNLDVEYGKYKELDEIPVVIVKTGERLVGLVIDELLNQQEIVIKSLGKYLLNVEHISGATIVGDGDVALILDVRNIA